METEIGNHIRQLQLKAEKRTRTSGGEVLEDGSEVT
jgi:hypothetical protein